MKISVILSSSTEFRNTGMFSVDYAAHTFFKEIFPECEIEFHVFHLSGEKSYPYNELVPYDTYRKIDEDSIPRIYASDLIVYWSDFFHTRHFFEQYMENYVFKYSDDVERDKNLFFKTFFLEGGNKSVFKKTIAFGNSHMFMDPEEKTKTDRYSLNLKNLYSKIKVSMPRDKMSFANVKNNTEANCLQGCDPAFLIPKTEGIRRERKLGFFIGRRTKIKLRDIWAVIKFARKHDLKIEWINWMVNTESFFIRSIKNPSQAKNLFLHCALSFVFGKKKYFYENDFTTLQRFSIVVTDTYHLAINSIREEVPVFCIGDEDDLIYGNAHLDLSDKKKKVLFDMMENSAFYGNITESRLEWVLYKLGDFSKYKSKVKWIKATLTKYCKNIVGK